MSETPRKASSASVISEVTLVAEGEIDTPLWITATNDLSPEDKKEIELPKSDSPSLLDEVLNATEEKMKECLDKRWKFTNHKGQKIVLRNVFDKIIVWIDKFKKVGDIAMQYDPGHAALPWACVRFFLQCAVNDVETFGCVLEGMELVSHLINRYAIFEKLYLRKELLITDQLRRALIRLYSAVLRYLARAKRFYSQGSGKRLLKSVVQFYEVTFGPLLEAIRREQLNVDYYARLADAEYQKLAQDTVNALQSSSNKAREELKKILSDLERPISNISLHLSELHDELQLSKRREILKWISIIPYEQHHENIRRDRLEESGRWLLQKDEFSEWEKSSASSILWLHGIPGSGKSKLVSLVVDDVKEANLASDTPEPLAFFYCARDPAEPERGVPVSIFRSLVRQLACLKPSYPIMSPVLAKYASREESNFGFTDLSLDECVDLILELGKVYPSMALIIDALDECEPDTRLEILEKLDEILQDSTNLVKIFVSSREDSDLVCKLENSPNLYIEAVDNKEDIERFVKGEVERSIKSKKLLRGCISSELKDLTVTTLIDGAQGMFRWASLQLQNLCNPRRMKMEKDVRRELGRLPEKLADIYAEVYDQISEAGPNSQLVASRALKWLICGQRRLSSNEFLAAISLDLHEENEDEEYGEEDHESTQVSKQQILDVCCNLVTYDMDLDTFRFAHLSVREYLEIRPEYTQALSHIVAAEACLYVLVEKGSSSAVSSQIEAFHNYSVIYWAFHCQISAGKRETGRYKELFQEYFWPLSSTHTPFEDWIRASRHAWWYLNYGDHMKEKLQATWSSPPSKIFIACVFGFQEILQRLLATKGFETEAKNDSGERPLYISARYGHLPIASALLQEGANVHIKGGIFGNALQAAAFAGSETVVALLLEHHADVNVFGGRYAFSLQAASEQRNTGVVKLLLRNGADVNSKGGRQYTALHASIWGGSQETARILLQHGADINTNDPRHGTALTLAAEKGSQTLIKLLLNHGADINAIGKRSGSALQVAAECGSLEITNLLLKNKASLRFAGGRYQNALLSAVWGGNEAIVRLFLDQGADIEVSGGKYGHVLQAAAWGDQLAIVKLLLERGANVNAQGGQYGTALQAAAVAGNEHIVRLLIEHGALVNTQVGLYGNALHAAAERGNEAVAVILLNHGADLNFDKGVRGTALQAAAWGGNEGVAKLLLEKGINTRANGGEYGNALQMAALRGKLEVVELLIDVIDINDEGGKFGNTLQAAIWGANVEIISQVLHRGVDVNQKGGLYGSALQAAAVVDKKEIVNLLLDCGAGIEADGSLSYLEALRAAEDQNNDGIVQLLKSHFEPRSELPVPAEKGGETLVIRDLGVIRDCA
ncbi:MAG: hypothetical protein M1814_006051 [Vezdaea aestivalis]|nr:MAG: hypothetical protein M1814_006051 [Vezdaea aestivalis]